MKIIINFYLLMLALAILISNFSQKIKINTKRFATNHNDYAVSVLILSTINF
jgi:hypothetical protein